MYISIYTHVICMTCKVCFNGVRDKDRGTIRLDDFIKKKEAVETRLSKAEVREKGKRSEKEREIAEMVSGKGEGEGYS